MPVNPHHDPRTSRAPAPKAQPRGTAPGTPADQGPPAGAIASLVGALLVVAFLARLASRAAGAMFYTDECFHAHVTQWIAAHHRLPGIMPELYSGFYYYYPPLLHVVGAMWIALLGEEALPLLNVGFTALLLAALWFWPSSRAGSRARLWALLLCLSSGAVAFHAVRFYVEALLALVTLCATLLLVRFWRTGRMRDAALVGAATGLALLTKQTALLMLPGLLALALFCAARRDGRRAAGFAAALGTALLVALPMFVRNQVLFGDPIYPVLARDTDRALFEMNVRHFAVPLGVFYREILTASPLVVAAGVIALVLAVLRRRATHETALVAGIALAIGGAAYAPLADPRHVYPLIPPLALLGAGALSTVIGTRRIPARAVGIGLFGAAALAVARMRDYRSDLDVPAYLAEAYAAIRREVPEGGNVMSLWTYDTFYYSRRNATWPIPWGQRVRFTELFRERDPARFLAILDRSGIDHILVPRWKPSEDWSGVNYPRSLIDCVDSLGSRRQLRKLWESEWLVLVARVPGTSGSAPPAPPSAPVP